MSYLAKSLYWSSAMILLAIGNAAGWVSDASATTMFAILPVLAILSLSGQAGCFLSRESHA